MSKTFKFKLKYPYKRSLFEMESLVAIWGLSVLHSSTHSPFVFVSISDECFTRMLQPFFNGKSVEVVEPLTSFVESIKLEGIDDTEEPSEEKQQNPTETETERITSGGIRGQMPLVRNTDRPKRPQKPPAPARKPRNLRPPA